MPHALVFIFLILSTVFALTHALAVKASLYWYYWWFDIVMHFWGGVLVVLGVYALTTFSRIHFLPNLRLVLIALTIITLSWELFEWSVGLFNPETYWFDTIKDLVVGFSGGLLAYAFLRTYTIR